MTHRLEPIDERSYLSPASIVERLRHEFSYVAADSDEGSKVVGKMIAKLEELKAPQAIIDQARFAQSEAIAVEIADEMGADSYLRFTVKPHEGILIEYHSAQHEEAANSLLLRCARVLCYRIEQL